MGSLRLLRPPAFAGANGARPLPLDAGLGGRGR